MQLFFPTFKTEKPKKTKQMAVTLVKFYLPTTPEFKKFPDGEKIDSKENIEDVETMITPILNDNPNIDKEVVLSTLLKVSSVVVGSHIYQLITKDEELFFPCLFQS